MLKQKCILFLLPFRAQVTWCAGDLVFVTLRYLGLQLYSGRQGVEDFVLLHNHLQDEVVSNGSSDHGS